MAKRTASELERDDDDRVDSSRPHKQSRRSGHGWKGSQRRRIVAERRARISNKSRTTESEDGHTDESQEDEANLLPPPYDDLAQQTPEDRDAARSQILPDDTPRLERLRENNEYLAMRNKAYYEEIQHLRGKLSAATSTTSYKDEMAHRKAAQDLVKSEQAENRATIQRLKDHNKRVESALRHARARIQVMEPVYADRFRDATLNCLLMDRVDERHALDNAKVVALRGQLRETEETLARCRVDLQTGVGIVRNLDDQIVVLQQGAMQFNDKKDVKDMLFALHKRNQDLKLANHALRQDKYTQDLEIIYYKGEAFNYKAQTKVHKDVARGLYRDLDIAEEENLNLTKKLIDKVLAEGEADEADDSSEEA